MKVKVRFKAISYRGKNVSFTEEIECPDFEQQKPVEINGRMFPGATVESQIIDWLDSLDKWNLMIRRDLAVILDYWLKEEKKPRTTLAEYLKALNVSDKMMADMMAVYPEIKHLMKGKPAHAKAELLISHLNVGYASASNAYERITAILRGGQEKHTGTVNELKGKIEK